MALVVILVMFYPGDNFGMDEHDTVERVSPKYPRRNRKKKQPLVIDFENRHHNVFLCSKSQEDEVPPVNEETNRRI